MLGALQSLSASQPAAAEVGAVPALAVSGTAPLSSRGCSCCIQRRKFGWRRVPAQPCNLSTEKHLLCRFSLAVLLVPAESLLGAFAARWGCAVQSCRACLRAPCPLKCGHPFASESDGQGSSLSFMSVTPELAETEQPAKHQRSATKVSRASPGVLSMVRGPKL